MAFSRRISGIAFLIGAALVGIALLAISSPSQANAGGGGGGGSSLPTNCPAFSTAPPVQEAVPGYSSTGPAVLYPSNAPLGGREGETIPTSVQNAWYNNMPSPGVCGNEQMGVCIAEDFGNTQGTRVAAITASTTNLVFGAPPPMQATVDAVTTLQSNTCGQTATHWSWVTTPASASQNVYVPKNTTVQVSYSCQPNQTYDWETHTSCFLGIGICNVKNHARTFYFATQASSSQGALSSKLSGQTTFTAQAGQSYTLACGGYRPENGSATPPTYAASNSNSGVCIFGIDCSGGTDFASYNVADPSYWQPGIQLSVNQCSGDDEIVVNNVCTPCSTLKPGSWRVDNICVSSTPTDSIDALVGGKSVSSVPAGTKVTIQGVYLSTTTDPITGVAINGGTKDANTSVCGSGSGCLQTTYGVKKAVATSTYTFTPSAPGTYTFYPSVETTVLNVWKNYGDVSKTITVTPPCPANATQNGNTCTCKDQYFAYIGSSCVLTCPQSMHTAKSGNTCIVNLPTSAMIDFSATRVRSGSPSTLSWSIGGMVSGISCDIAPHAGLKSVMPAWTGNATWAGSIPTTPITEPTKFTLICTNGEETVSKDVTAQLIPEYQEI